MLFFGVCILENLNWWWFQLFRLFGFLNNSNVIEVLYENVTDMMVMIKGRVFQTFECPKN